MANPPIHGKPRVVTASMILEAMADDLSRIKSEDGLKWSDIGEVLGKSEDQAAKYADASAEMGLIAYTKGRRAWNGRFTGSVDKLVESNAEMVDAQVAQTTILKCALALSVALQDGELTDEEILANRSTLQNAKDAIDAQLARVGPKGQRA